MAEIDSRPTNIKKYRVTCKRCGTSSIYERWELHNYEDCYADKCVECRCPVCGNWNSLHISELPKIETKCDNNKLPKCKSNKSKFLENQLVLFILALIGYIVVLTITRYLYYTEF